MKNLFLSLLFLCGLSACSMNQETVQDPLSGKWNGEITTQAGNFPVALNFVKNGEIYTGNIEIMGKSYDFRKVDASKLPVLVLESNGFDFQQRPVIYYFSGNLQNHQLSGNLSAENMGEMQIQAAK